MTTTRKKPKIIVDINFKDIPPERLRPLIELIAEILANEWLKKHKLID